MDKTGRETKQNILYCEFQAPNWIASSTVHTKHLPIDCKNQPYSKFCFDSFSAMFACFTHLQKSRPQLLKKENVLEISEQIWKKAHWSKPDKHYIRYG